MKIETDLSRKYLIAFFNEAEKALPEDEYICWALETAAEWLETVEARTLASNLQGAIATALAEQDPEWEDNEGACYAHTIPFNEVKDPNRIAAGRKLWLEQIADAVINGKDFPPPPYPPEI